MKFEKLSPRVQALLATSEHQFSGSAIAAASKQLQEEKAKREAEQTIRVLRNADTLLTMHTNNLRVIRAKEKEALATVKTFDKAFVQFVTDGDLEKFAKNAGVNVFQLTQS